jgi:hypothetical protein
VRLSEKLAAYVPPNIPNPNTVTPEALAESVEIARPACRGCDGKLLPGQPDGAYCHRCAEELACLEMYRQKQCNDDWNGLLCLAAGAALIVIAALSRFFWVLP